MYGHELVRSNLHFVDYSGFHLNRVVTEIDDVNLDYKYSLRITRTPFFIRYTVKTGVNLGILNYTQLHGWGTA